MAGTPNPNQDWLLAGSRKNVACLIDTMVVDADACNFKDLIDEIVEKILLVAMKIAIYMEVKSDQDILEMFAKHVGTKVVDMSIAYTLPSETPQWPIVSMKSVDISYNQPSH
ncbi:hypothetical protein BS78_01G336000 [Paspalum vaginatum]|nr:hypothetical protein BS78_01G336000 [Paspalum vaginatum]